MEKIEIKLPTELAVFARELINMEEWICVDDVVIEALCRFREQIQIERQREAWLKAEIQKGIDDIDQGKVYDEATVFDELDEILGRKPEPTR